MIVILHGNDKTGEEKGIVETIYDNLDNVIVYDLTEYKIATKKITGFCDLLQMTSMKKGK